MNEDEMRAWLVGVAARGANNRDATIARETLDLLIRRAATIERVRAMAVETLRLCRESGVPEAAAHLSPRAVLAALDAVDAPAGAQA